MNCRDCQQPMRQWAADNWFCEGCRLEWYAGFWKRLQEPEPKPGDVVTDKHGRKWRLQWERVTEDA